MTYFNDNSFNKKAQQNYILKGFLILKLGNHSKGDKILFHP